MDTSPEFELLKSFFSVIASSRICINGCNPAFTLGKKVIPVFTRTADPFFKGTDGLRVRAACQKVHNTDIYVVFSVHIHKIVDN